MPALVVTIAFGAVAYWMPPRYRSEVLLSSGAVVNRDLEGTDPVLDVQRAADRNQRGGQAALAARAGDPRVPSSTRSPTAPCARLDLQSMMGRITVKVQGNKTFLLGFEDTRPPALRRGGHARSPTC